MESLEKKVSSFIESNRLFAKSDRLLVGLSGGADSVCLLLVLHSLGYNVGCVHCNFHLRGNESDRDESFSLSLCQRLGVPIDIAHFDTATYSRDHGLSIEMGAREQRYAYFRKYMQEHGYTKICIAHHIDDSIETFFINLLRGSGIRGLCGIPVKNGTVVRPLLSCSRAEILEYLSLRGESYVTDSTNLGTDYLRNKIRLELLPLLETLSDCAKPNIHTTMSNLLEEKQVYDWCIGRMEEESSFVRDGRLYISKEGLLRSPSPLSLLHESVRDCGFHRNQLRQILSSHDSVGRMFYSSSFCLTVDRDYLIVSGIEESNDIYLEVHMDSSDGEIPLPDGSRLLYRQLSVSEMRINKTPQYAYFDKSKLSGPQHIRSIKEGDWFIPFGMRGRKLLSDYMTDQKLSRIDKSRQLVLEIGGRIAWVIGRRSSDEFKIDPSTRDVIEIFYDSDSK